MATSEKCCQLPPVSHEYTPKGTYQTIAGLNTYVVGPADASIGIVHVYDVFGVRPQTIQGADRLSAHTGGVVLVPDFFRGTGLSDHLVPPDTAEKKAALEAYLRGPGNFDDNLPLLLGVRREAAQRFPQVEGRWGVFGLCWGGKMAVLATGVDNEGLERRFRVSGQGHPAKLDEKDARALTCPHLVLASHDEPADLIAKYAEILAAEEGKGHVVETYHAMFHGWMGARANLRDEENAKEFERAYEQVASFFAHHLSA